MNRGTRRTPQAGGFIIAAAIVIGTLIGAANGQTSAGIVIGGIVGAILAGLIWLRDRR